MKARIISGILLARHGRHIFAVLGDLMFAFVVKVTKPKRIMEIGVSKGDGSEIMIRSAPNGVEYYGFDIKMDKNEVSKRLVNLGAKVSLFIGDTRKVLPALADRLPKMDLIYIDGDHSYEVCKSDWENARKLMHGKTTVIFDDYMINKDVKKVVNEIDRKIYDVSSTFPLSLGKAIVRMVS